MIFKILRDSLLNELILISENEKSSKINRNFKSNKNGNSGGMEMKFIRFFRKVYETNPKDIQTF